MADNGGHWRNRDSLPACNAITGKHSLAITILFVAAGADEAYFSTRPLGMSSCCIVIIPRFMAHVSGQGYMWSSIGGRWYREIKSINSVVYPAATRAMPARAAFPVVS